LYICFAREILERLPGLSKELAVKDRTKDSEVKDREPQQSAAQVAHDIMTGG